MIKSTTLAYFKKKKLKFFGISGPLYQWIQDFLIGREQTVIVNGSKSSSITVNSRVPQGTVLGPLLFLIYINDLPNCINTGTKVRLFADDCKIYRTIKTEKDSEMLQKDLDELQNGNLTGVCLFTKKSANY